MMSAASGAPATRFGAELVGSSVLHWPGPKAVMGSTILAPAAVQHASTTSAGLCVTTLSAFAADIIKCQLKPVTLSDYTQPLTAPQLQQIAAIFPTGVCDWSKPGVEQTKAVPYASFGPSPVNLVFDVTK